MTLCDKIIEQNGLLLARVSEPLVTSTRKYLKQELKPYIDRLNLRHVVFDMKYCNRIDAAGLGMLGTIADLLEKKSCRVSVVNVTDDFESALETTKMDETITPYASHAVFMAKNSEYAKFKEYIDYVALQQAAEGVL